VFYLKYHLYRITFPLMALGRYKAAMADSGVVSAVGDLA
jgi:hypothetical protein